MVLKKTMVAGDDMSPLKSTQAYLKDDFQVLARKDGRGVINSIHKENPDLVITDVLMAKMSGQELSRTRGNYESK